VPRARPEQEENMTINGRDAVAEFVAQFAREHPERAETLQPEALQRYLEQVYGEVLRGVHLAKTEQQLHDESEDAGIRRDE
jgi:hypothetical protein